MSHITLRRAAEQARSALNGWANHGLWAWPESALQTCKQNTEEALAALDAALAEPEQKPEPVAWMVTTTDERHFIFRMNKPVISEGETLTPLFTHPPAALAEPVHPGYIIGSHWLETAYSRIAAGEAEADVLSEVLGERGWAKREPVTRWNIERDGDALLVCFNDHEKHEGCRYQRYVPEPDAKREPATEKQVEAMMPRPAPSLEFLDGFREGFRAAERFRGIRKEGK